MTGCRYGAKNTLVKNYLGLAESAGAQVHPMTTVTGFKQRADGLWEVKTAHTGRLLRRKRRTFTANHLVLAAGTFGTQKLLFKMRDSGNLPKLSDKLGVLTRTNSESIVGAGRLEVRDDLDLTHGVAITSSIHPTSDTHVEPVRYGKGSNAMGLLQTLMTDGAGPAGHRHPALAAAAGPGGRGPQEDAAAAQPAALERADDDRAGDAAPGQLDHDLHQTHQARLPPDGQQAGPRRAQPDLDSGRQRGHPPSRREDRRRRGRHVGRAVQHPADRALPRRRGDRRQPRARRDRPVSAGIQLPDDVCGRRRRRLGEPRRQPLAEHHRAGRAGGVAVAEQGRAGPPAGARGSPTSGSPRSSPSIPSYPPTPSARCVACPFEPSEPVSSAG